MHGIQIDITKIIEYSHTMFILGMKNIMPESVTSFLKLLRIEVKRISRVKVIEEQTKYIITRCFSIFKLSITVKTFSHELARCISASTTRYVRIKLFEQIPFFFAYAIAHCLILSGTFSIKPTTIIKPFTVNLLDYFLHMLNLFGIHGLLLNKLVHDFFHLTGFFITSRSNSIFFVFLKTRFDGRHISPFTLFRVIYTSWIASQCCFNTGQMRRNDFNNRPLHWSNLRIHIRGIDSLFSVQLNTK